MPPKKLNPVKAGTRRVLYFTDKDARAIPAHVINGMTLEQIAEIYDVSPDTFKYNLSRSGNEKLKEAYRIAVAQAVADSTTNMRRLAEGFEYTESEWKASLDASNYENLLKDHKDTLLALIESGNVESFASFIVEKLFTNITDLKVYKKYAKPDLGANRDILKSLSNETWDLEGKHKKIAQTKIIVKVEGEPQRKREVKADYVVEA